MSGKNNTNIGFEKQIWDAACVLWGHIPAAEYRKVIVGLIFLRYISSAFEKRYEELLKEGDGFENDRDAYVEENIFFVPEKARWSKISSAAHTPEIGTVIDEAMRAIEKENASLKNVLPKNYASPDLDKRVLGEIVDLFTNEVKMDVTEASKDLLGRIYEYCIAQFAAYEGTKGGKFYTPSNIVENIVAILKPFNNFRFNYKKFLFITERKNMSVSYIVDNLEVNFIIILFLLLIFASFTGQERCKYNKKLNIFTLILLMIFLALSFMLIYKYIPIGLRYLSEKASKLEAIVMVAFITGTLTFLTTVISKISDYKQEKSKFLMNKREASYAKFIRIVCKTLLDDKTGFEYSQDEMTKDLNEISGEFTLWGSKKVVNKFIEFSNESANNNAPKNLLSDLEDIINEMRKDLGVGKTDKGKLLSIFINDMDKLK